MFRFRKLYCVRQGTKTRHSEKPLGTRFCEVDSHAAKTESIALNRAVAWAAAATSVQNKLCGHWYRSVCLGIGSWWKLDRMYWKKGVADHWVMVDGTRKLTCPSVAQLMIRQKTQSLHLRQKQSKKEIVSTEVRKVALQYACILKDWKNIVVVPGWISRHYNLRQRWLQWLEGDAADSFVAFLLFEKNFAVLSLSKMRQTVVRFLLVRASAGLILPGVKQALVTR